MANIKIYFCYRCNRIEIGVIVKKIIIRKARKKDLPSVLSLIKELATYEQAPNEVKVTLKELERDGFGRKKVYDCFVAEIQPRDVGQFANGTNPSFGGGTHGKGKYLKSIAGMALYYTKYSTWKGRCLYLEDIIVTESMRRKGIGKKLFEGVIAVAKKIKVKKLEWQVLNWNEPAISFYKKYSTVFDDNEWMNCKLIFVPPSRDETKNKTIRT